MYEHVCRTLIAHFFSLSSHAQPSVYRRELPVVTWMWALIHSVMVCVFQRGLRATDLKDQIACRTFCLSVRLPGTMLTILAAGSVFFPGLFLLSKQCLKSIPSLRWSEGDAVIVSARLALWNLFILCFNVGSNGSWLLHYLTWMATACSLKKALLILTYSLCPLSFKMFPLICILPFIL